MKLSQIRFESGADIKLRALKARTGLTPNILCRIAFGLSIEDRSALNPEAFPADGDRIIDRHVLLGPWDSLFVALMKERFFQDGEDPNDEDLLGKHFRAHVHRGIHLLFKRVKNLSDMAHLLPRSTVVPTEEVNTQEEAA